MEKIRRTLLVFRARFLISMKIYFRYPINFIMTCLEPIMWLTPFYFLGKSFSVNGIVPGFKEYTGNSDYMGFLVLGFMVSSYVSTVFWGMGFSLKDEMTEGVLESNWSSPVSRITLMISKSLFQFCAATFEIVLTGIVCHFVFGFSINSHILKALVFLIPGIIGMLGLGLAVGALVLLLKEANTIIDITNAAVTGFCGGFFPIKVLPKGFLFISLAIPLTYIYDSTRGILLNQGTFFSLKTEFIAILISMVVLNAIGSFIFLRVERRCRMVGDLGTH